MLYSHLILEKRYIFLLVNFVHFLNYFTNILRKNVNIVLYNNTMFLVYFLFLFWILSPFLSLISPPLSALFTSPFMLYFPLHPMNYRVSHKIWQLVNSFECLLPYTVLDIKDFLQLISLKKTFTFKSILL